MIFLSLYQDPFVGRVSSSNYSVIAQLAISGHYHKNRILFVNEQRIKTCTGLAAGVPCLAIASQINLLDPEDAEA